MQTVKTELNKRNRKEEKDRESETDTGRDEAEGMTEECSVFGRKERRDITEGGKTKKGRWWRVVERDKREANSTVYVVS